MNQRTHLYRSVSLENSIKQLKHCLALAIREIKHLACSLDANKAIDFALCFISILAARLVLYFTYSTRGNALTYTHSYMLLYTHAVVKYAVAVTTKNNVWTQFSFKLKTKLANSRATVELQ